MSLDPEDLKEIIDEFIVEAGELLEQLDQDLVALEDSEENADLINRIFRNLHTIKGTANFLNSEQIFATVGKLGHAAEDVMGALRENKLTLTPDIMDAILESVDLLKRFFSAYSSGQRQITEPQALITRLRSFLNPDANTPTPSPKPEIKLPSNIPDTNASLPEPPSLSQLDFDEDDLQEIVGDFLIESKELLEHLDKDLITLETDLENREILDQIFRHLHTVKGGANFLGGDPNFQKVARLAHTAEDLLGALRQGSIELNRQMMDYLLDGVDSIKKIILDIESGKVSDLDPNPIVIKLQSFLNPDQEMEEEETPKAANTGEASLSQAEEDEILKDFLDESKELVDKIDRNLLMWEQFTDDPSFLKEIFRCVHTLKGTSSFLEFPEITKLAHAVEDVLRDIQNGFFTVSSEALDIFSQAVRLWKQFFTSNQKKYGEDFILRSEELISKLGQLKNSTPELGESSKSSPQKETTKPVPKKAIEQSEKTSSRIPASLSDQKGTIEITKRHTRTVSTAEQTIRVETKRLDSLMNLVGELVLGRNRLLQVIRKMSDKTGVDQDLQAAVDFIDFLTSDFQMAVLKTRMQPIGKIFNRFTRTVRDLARETGKEVKLVVEGAETELDKSVIDELGDPLTHLLRNAVDHGIEPPEVRRASGKAEMGIIKLSAFHEGSYIIIELRDDGKGIDPEIILEKAIQKNLVTASDAERMSPRQIMEFIFAPGFSTAAQVTSLSGRGVGMDVVKSNLEKLNGVINIDSEIDQGTVFRIRLPLTLAIIQALQVKASSEIYAIPLASVIETLRVNPHQIQSLSGKEVIRFRDMIVPLVYLDDLFGLEPETRRRDRIYIVVAGIAEKKIGIVVDRIIRQEEIVVKSLGKLLKNIPGVSGACIGGDGRGILILDIASLLRTLPVTMMARPVNEKRDQMRAFETKRLVGKASFCILIVEDSRSERKRTRMIIEKKGHKVIEAIDGKDAMSKLTDYQIDMVITDIEMPGVDGYQLTSKIREHNQYQNIPVIAVSSHREMVDRIRGMEVGINTYLPKPIQEQELIAAIKSFTS